MRFLFVVLILQYISAHAAPQGDNKVNKVKSSITFIRMLQAESVWSPPAFYIDDKGVTDAKTAKKIIEDGAETLTYKVGGAGIIGGGLSASLAGQEDRKFVIKRDAAGNILSAQKYFDVNVAKENVKKMKAYLKTPELKIPIVESVEQKYITEGTDSVMDQEIVNEKLDENSKTDSKLTYDKKACEILKPLINELGRRNTTACANFILQSNIKLDKRHDELKKEGKSFYFETRPKPGLNNFNLSAFITSCMLKEHAGELGYNAYPSLDISTSNLMGGASAGPGNMYGGFGGWGGYGGYGGSGSAPPDKEIIDSEGKDFIKDEGVE